MGEVEYEGEGKKSSRCGYVILHTRVAYLVMDPGIPVCLDGWFVCSGVLLGGVTHLPKCKVHHNTQVAGLAIFSPPPHPPHPPFQNALFQMYALLT